MREFMPNSKHNWNVKASGHEDDKMLNVNQQWIKQVEQRYPGIGRLIRRFEEADLPVCSHCGSDNTADVQCGVVGITIHLAAATTKFKLLFNGPKPGRYFCNACAKFFGKGTEEEENPATAGKNLNASDLLDMVKKHGGATVKVVRLKRGAKGES